MHFKSTRMWATFFHHFSSFCHHLFSPCLYSDPIWSMDLLNFFFHSVNLICLNERNIDCWMMMSNCFKHWMCITKELQITNRYFFECHQVYFYIQDCISFSRVERGECFHLIKFFFWLQHGQHGKNWFKFDFKRYRAERIARK